ncbi:hypothetical protein [Streptomyces sp. NBC_01803]|uniref:hypothetical protein n=1 Tax=Streptomyces sp. NBC_01803 TaxID=2975946 RepID=UPI002DDA7AE2|nr:hypothetical protein [Streptomyces sp. NBC_01803]WSA46357.1 hypothetical protein OIE51_20510 [Streptomyces sp. NBC_01803]
MVSDEPHSAPGLAEVRIIAASPEAARQIAETLRLRFATTVRRGHPVDDRLGETTLHLTVDTARPPEDSGPFRPRLVTGPPHADEV